MPYTYTITAHPTPLLALAVLVLAGSGCRSATDVACPAGPVSVTVASSNNVVPGSASAFQRMVTRPGGMLSAAVRVPSLAIRPEDVQFTGTGTGTVSVALAIDGYVATVGTLNISGGTVAGFTPTPLVPGQFNRDDARAIIDALPESQRTALNLRNLDAVSETQISDAVSDAVRDGSFALVVLTRTTSGLQGSVSIQRIAFDIAC